MIPYKNAITIVCIVIAALIFYICILVMVTEISDIRKYPRLFVIRYPKLSENQILLAYFAFLKFGISISGVNSKYNVEFIFVGLISIFTSPY